MGVEIQTWLEDNFALVALVVIVLAAFVAVRLMTKMVARAVALGLAGILALFVSMERDALRECARTCQCDLAGQEVNVPRCTNRLPGDG